jgi:hypothetical protein
MNAQQLELKKAPSSKLQAPEKLQIPRSKTLGAGFAFAALLKFDVWCFSGAWSLELGVFRDSPA